MSNAPSRDRADPVHPAIEAVRRAHAEAVAILVALNEDDPATVCLANAAVDRGAETYAALCRVTPDTVAGLMALLSFHAEHITEVEPDALGGVALRHLADVAAAVLGSAS